MKKAAVIMTGVLALASLLVLMTSCKKECTCTIQDEDGDKYTISEFPENYNAKNCKDLGSMMTGGGVLVKCN